MKHALEFGDVYFEVDPLVGGRVTSFRLGGADVLTGPDVDAHNYGSTFWTSPQSDWGWPPPVEVDRHPYDVSAGADSLTLTSSPHDALGIRVTKRFVADRARGAVELEYGIHNVSATPKTYAPWEVSRVRSGGLTFFPTGAWFAGPLRVERCTTATWFDHDPSALNDAGQKSAADGVGGFVAHAASGLLFLNTLFDENAACHIALGQAYSTCLKDGGELTQEQLASRGANNSLIHVDWMIGSNRIDVDGISAGGDLTPVMRAGEWV